MEITMRAETSEISTVNSASSSENAASSSNEVGAENLKRKRNQSSEDLSKKPKLGNYTNKEVNLPHISFKISSINGNIYL